ncbi:MAG: hypothetical protein IJM44_00050 [Ruminococcus sp.]|nr:hypothetical protein [Ruminococcus sp.]
MPKKSKDYLKGYNKGLKLAQEKDVAGLADHMIEQLEGAKTQTEESVGLFDFLDDACAVHDSKGKVLEENE